MSDEIWVLAELAGDQVTQPTNEALGAAKKLAAGGGQRVVAVVLGRDAGAPALRALGAADAVLTVNEPALTDFSPALYVKVLEVLLGERKPRLVLMGSTSASMELGPDLSARLGSPLIAYCRDLELSGGKLVGTSQLYGGKLLLEVESDAPQVLVMLAAGAFPVAAEEKEVPVEVIGSPVSLGDSETVFLGLEVAEAADVDITQSEVLISVGRGIGDAGNISLAEELAEALGGVVSASRPVVDQGWLAKSRQVGKSGKTVKPKFYLAAGISGAPEHLEGMRDADLIVAINTDPTAPIFEVADYGVVGDCTEILPALTEAVASQG